MTEYLYADILATCLSFLMGGLSVIISIFTLSTSAIISKRELRNDLERQIEEGGVSLTLTRKIKTANTFINKMRKVTDNCIVVCILFVIGIIAYVIFRFIKPTWWIMCLVGIVGGGIIYILFVIYLLLNWYLKTNKL